jgi:hypothetical protein
MFIMEKASMLIEIDWRLWVQISGPRPVILNEIFRGFPQSSPRKITEYYIQLSRDIHTVWAADSVVK